MSTLPGVISAATEFMATLPAALPDPDPIHPPGTDRFTDVMGWVKWVALAICIIGIMIAGAMMAVQSRRGEGGEHAGKVGMALAGVIVISAAAALVGFLTT